MSPLLPIAGVRLSMTRVGVQRHLTQVGWAICATWWCTWLLFRLWVFLVYPAARAGIFVDARLYRLASLAWLEGRDPWGNLGLHLYAAPPPTLLFTAPLALAPEAAAIPAFALVMAAAIVFAIRRLGLPWLLLVWPPLVDAFIVGNPNAMLVALLITRLAPLAVLAKVYAIIPLAWERRGREVAVSIGLLLVTAPLLPWGTYFAERGTIEANMAAQVAGLSAWGTPLLLVLPALVVLGRPGGWLAVPAAWPLTQFGYSAIALPVAGLPWVALALSLPIPLAAPATVVVWAAWIGIERLANERRERNAGLRRGAKPG